MDGDGDKMEEGVEHVAEGVQKLATESPQEENPLYKVLNNNLVCQNITSYLTLSDMKSVSEVSRAFHQMIRGTTRFNSKAMLLVSKNTVELDHMLVNTEHPWRAVKIDVTLPIEVLDILPSILQSVETVALVRLREGAKLEDALLVKFILGILSATPNLTHLQIDLRFLEKILYDVFSSPKVQENMKNLKVLEILEWDYERSAFKTTNGASYFVDSTTWRDDDEESDEDGPFARNFLQLAHLPMALQTFRMNKVSTIERAKNGFMKFVPAILNNNRETLEELSVHLNVWEMEELRAMRLPLLKRLTVTINPEDQDTLAEFLTNHPLLEELEVGVRQEFKRSLFAAIQGRSAKLRKLHLKAKQFTGFGVTPIDWTFLEGMKYLKDFRIARPHTQDSDLESYGTGPRILAALPKNQLRSLSFKGISELGFWKESGGANDDDEEGTEPELSFKTDLLSGFTGLKRLSLIRCHDSVDDKLMQYLFNNFTALEELEISHCYTLTDAGLTGDSKEDNEQLDSPGVSIASLRCLKSLSIRACPSITTEGLLSCVSLPYLKSFDYLTTVAVPKSFVLTFATQNASLETLAVHLSPLDTPLEMKTELKTNNPRLAKLINLNNGDWVEEDSDSDADQVGYGFDGDGDSDISGGGFYPGDAYLDELDDYDEDYDNEDDDDDDYPF